MTPAPTLPSLRGKLSGTSLGELLALALDRELSGSVVVETHSREKNVLVLETGRLTKAQTASSVVPLGQLLLARRELEASDLDAALVLSARRGGRLGQSLVELELLAPEVLERSLAEQLARRLTWLARLPPTSTFAYYDDVDLLAHTPAIKAEARALLWRSIREAPEPHPRQREVLESLAGSSLGLSPGAAPQELALSVEERRLVEVLKVGAVSLPALVSSCALTEERAHRLVYTLQLTHQLVVRAHQPSRGQNAPAEAAGAFHAALSCVSRKRFGEAESFARAARDAEPSNPEYLALHAWLRMHAGALSTPAEAAQIVGALDRAVVKARESVAIRLYRAQVLKRLGRAEEAFKDFRFVARREPNNLDAVREVRLHLMRARNQQKASGVFSKLFLR